MGPRPRIELLDHHMQGQLMAQVAPGTVEVNQVQPCNLPVVGSILKQVQAGKATTEVLQSEVQLHTRRMHRQGAFPGRPACPSTNSGLPRQL